MGIVKTFSLARTNANIIDNGGCGFIVNIVPGRIFDTQAEAESAARYALRKHVNHLYRNDLSVTTAAGETFEALDLARMTSLIYTRFGRSLDATRDALARLFQSTQVDRKIIQTLVEMGIDDDLMDDPRPSANDLRFS